MRTAANLRVVKMTAKKTKPDKDGFSKSINFDTVAEGEALAAIVTGVKVVRRGDVFDKSQYGNDDDSLVAVRIEVTPELTFVYYMKAPIANAPVNPSSNFAKWKKGYGDEPKAGQDVTVRMNDKGFYQPIF